jgi:ABC-2 type transport system ATP-binding protein
VASSEAGQLEVSGLTSDEIGTRAAAEGITLFELSPVQASLEQAFMELTRDEVEFRSIDDGDDLPPRDPATNLEGVAA